MIHRKRKKIRIKKEVNERLIHRKKKIVRKK